MDLFYHITIEATDNGKTYTAGIHVPHIVAITGARRSQESATPPDLHAIHLVNGDKVYVRMTYSEILNVIRNCAALDLHGG